MSYENQHKETRFDDYMKNKEISERDEVLKELDNDPILYTWKSEYPFIIGLFKPKEEYTLFRNRIRITVGRMSQYTHEVHFKKIEQIALKSSLLGRIFNVGEVELVTKFRKDNVYLKVKDPQNIFDIINQAMHDEKQAYLHSKGKGNNAYSHNHANKNKKVHHDEHYKKQMGLKKEKDDTRNIAP